MRRYDPKEDPETRRKRLLWQASHRGLKEMDILLGGFANAHMASFTPAELDEMDVIVSLPDPDLLSWAMSQAPVPQALASPLLLRFLASVA